MAARLLLILILTVGGLAVPALAQPPVPRDLRPASVSGASSITGVVVSDEEQPRPLRRARVTLNGPALAVGRTLISNDDGTFAFERLPPGRYIVGAAKDGYISMNYGARRSGRPGTSMAVAAGETKSLTVRLARGGVVTGTLTDALGQPVAGVEVLALTYRVFASTGERRLMPAGLSVGASDDRGVYRIFGLPAGDYHIIGQVRARLPGGPVQLQVLSPAEVRSALDQVRNPARSQFTRPGTAPSAGTREGAQTVAIAPVYYPGTTVSGQATTVKVSAGEERAGIDFQIQPVPTATVSVTLSMRDGTAPPTSAILTRIGDPFSYGTYRGSGNGPLTFSGVPPGAYGLMARGDPAGPPTVWISQDFVVDGQNIAVELPLQPALTIAGRVVFEGSKSPPNLSGLRIPPLATLFRGNIAQALPAAHLEADGRFRIPGVIPGQYTLGTVAGGLRTPLGTWWMKSIVIDGRDVLDAPLEFHRSTHDAVVTFSDRASDLAGAVTDAEGNPLSDRYVIVFSTDKASWFVNSRRIAAVRPGPDGRYSIRNLPPGDYFFVLSDDIEQSEWFDPSVLQRLTPGSTRISIGANEEKKHDVRVAAGG